MGAEACAILGVALDLAEESFTREYEQEVGLVMPGVFAVSPAGRQLTRFALLSDAPEAVPSDQAFASIVKEAISLGLEKIEVVGAWAAIRIEVGWPRIIAWHQSGLTCEAKPYFTGAKLTSWDETWGQGFSTRPPEGSRDGLLEIEMPSVDGAGLALLVRDRLGATCRTRALT
jgi:hypothetical protein